MIKKEIRGLVAGLISAFIVFVVMINLFYTRFLIALVFAIGIGIAIKTLVDAEDEEENEEDTDNSQDTMENRRTFVSKYMNLTEDETIIQEVKGDAYNLSANPIARLMGTILRVLSIIFGFRKKTHIVITNKRVVRIDFEKILWVIDKGVSATSITPRSINNVGYSRVRVLLLFKTRYFTIETSSGDTFIKFQGTNNRLLEAVDNISNMLEKIEQK